MLIFGTDCRSGMCASGRMDWVSLYYQYRRDHETSNRRSFSYGTNGLKNLHITLLRTYISSTKSYFSNSSCLRETDVCPTSVGTKPVFADRVHTNAEKLTLALMPSNPLQLMQQSAIQLECMTRQWYCKNCRAHGGCNTRM